MLVSPWKAETSGLSGPKGAYLNGYIMSIPSMIVVMTKRSAASSDQNSPNSLHRWAILSSVPISCLRCGTTQTKGRELRRWLDRYNGDVAAALAYLVDREPGTWSDRQDGFDGRDFTSVMLYSGRRTTAAVVLVVPSVASMFTSLFPC